MEDRYAIRIARTPDGKLIVTHERGVPLGTIVGETDDESALIRLDIIDRGQPSPIWISVPREKLGASDLKELIEEKRADIINEFERSR